MILTVDTVSSTQKPVSQSYFSVDSIKAGGVSTLLIEYLFNIKA